MQGLIQKKQCESAPRLDCAEATTTTTHSRLSKIAREIDVKGRRGPLSSANPFGRVIIAPIHAHAQRVTRNSQLRGSPNNEPLACFMAKPR